MSHRVILSGSFNPLHEGHTQLLHAASLKCNDSKVCYEMTLNNADKGALAADDPQILARIEQFTSS